MSYQPIYDAARSQIGHCNTAQVVENAAREAFDISWQKQQLTEMIQYAAEDDAREAVIQAAKRLSVVEVGSIDNRIEHLNLIKALDALAELEGK